MTLPRPRDITRQTARLYYIISPQIGLSTRRNVRSTSGDLVLPLPAPPVGVDCVCPAFGCGWYCREAIWMLGDPSTTRGQAAGLPLPLSDPFRYRDRVNIPLVSLIKRRKVVGSIGVAFGRASADVAITV